MTDDFSNLFHLLDQVAPEVSGRGSATISPEIRQRLAKLATGGCNERERSELIGLLEKDPELVAALATEIKSLREFSK